MIYCLGCYFFGGRSGVGVVTEAFFLKYESIVISTIIEVISLSFTASGSRS